MGPDLDQIGEEKNGRHYIETISPDYSRNLSKLFRYRDLPEFKQVTCVH